MIFLIRVACVIALVTASEAAIIQPVSYTMFNGGLSDIPFGDIPFVDESYNGVGQKDVNYALLEGGVGDLTDGFASPESWDANPLSYLPWLGWSGEFDPLGSNPIITFLFSQSHSFQTLRIHVDDTDGVMNVEVPGSVEVSDGVTNLIFNLAEGGSGPQWFDLDITGLSGDTINLTLNQRQGYHWVFLDEVEFNDSTSGPAVPEPATWTMVGSALAGAALLMRRRKLRP